MSYDEVRGEKSSINFRVDFILRVPDCIVTISLGCILYCGCFNLFCNVWVCVCVCCVMCGCFGNMCTCIYCVLYSLYCVFVMFRSCIFILICFVCKDYCLEHGSVWC